MAKPVIDLRALGIPELDAKLAKLDPRVQKKVVRKALRDHAKVVKGRVVDNLSGSPVQVRTGELRAAYQAAKIRGATRRGVIRISVEAPPRDLLGVAAGDRHYYPYAIEYGHRRAQPHPFMRPAIDDFVAQDLRTLGDAIGRGVIREALKK